MQPKIRSILSFEHLRIWRLLEYIEDSNCKDFEDSLVDWTLLFKVPNREIKINPEAAICCYPGDKMSWIIHWILSAGYNQLDVHEWVDSTPPKPWRLQAARLFDEQSLIEPAIRRVKSRWFNQQARRCQLARLSKVAGGSLRCRAMLCLHFSRHFSLLNLRSSFTVIGLTRTIGMYCSFEESIRR